MTFTCFYNINRGEYLFSENMLIVLAPLFIVLFEKWLKNFLYVLILVIFFSVRTYDYLSRDAELDKMFFSSSMIYMVLFLGLYFFLNSYKSAFHRIYEDQNLLIDQLAAQKEQLEEINKTKNKLFSIVTHDLKRPVHMLGGLLDLDDKKLLDEEQKKHFSKQINENILGINSLIENVLAWARSQLEGFTVNRRSFQVCDILNKEMVVYEQQAQAKEIKFSTNFPKELKIESDLDQLSLVVRNIVNNSIKFTPKGGNITVSTAKHYGYLNIMIKDTGV